MNRTSIKLGLLICLFFIIFSLSLRKAQAAYDYEYHQLYFANWNANAGLSCNNSSGGINCNYAYYLGKKGIDWSYVAVYKRSVDDEGTMTFSPMWSSATMPKNENISYYSDQMGDVPGDSPSTPKRSFNIWFSNSGGGSTGFNFYFYIARPQKTLQSLAISPATSTLTSGQTQQFTATATYSDNTTKDITTSSTWTVAANIGTINNTSSKGLFTASAASIQTGQVSASYTESGVTKAATANVTVSPAQSILVKVTPTDPVNPASPGVPKGQTAKYSVAITSFGFAGNINLNISKKTYFDNNTSNNTTPDDWFDIKFNDISNSTTVSVPKDGTVNVTMTITSTNNARTDIQGIYSFFVNGTNGASITGGTWAFLKVLEGVASGISATGDIYSGINIGNLNIGAKSVLAAQTITPVDNPAVYWKISPYAYSKLSLMQNTMNKNIARLENENSVKINPPTADIGFWYLNNNSATSPKDSGDGKYPEGKVWVVNGNLTLNATKFYGKGTIIVKNPSGGLGTVNINGNLTYDDSGTNSLGIIAKDINIASGVNVVRGAFYASEAINIQ